MNPNNKVWTPRDEQILRDEFNCRTTREIASMLGRTYQATAVKASKMGLKKDHYGLVWTEQQLKLLRDHFPTMFNKPLARWIGVSQRTLNRKAADLGIKKKPGFLDERRKDINAMAREGMMKPGRRTNPGWFKKGVRNNPAGEFQPGHRESPESRDRRIASLRRHLQEKKKALEARLELDMNLHPEKYYV